MTWIHGDWIEDEAGGWAFVPYVRQLFERAGWQPLARPAPSASGDAMAYATLLLNEFGGLTVGKSGAGVDCAANNLEFLQAPRPVAAHWVRRWPRLRTAVMLGRAHDTYIDVLVDANGDFLLVTEIDERLYDFGNDFVRVAEILLRGLAWPRPVDVRACRQGDARAA